MIERSHIVSYDEVVSNPINTLDGRLYECWAALRDMEPDPGGWKPDVPDDLFKEGKPLHETMMMRAYCFWLWTTDRERECHWKKSIYSNGQIDVVHSKRNLMTGETELNSDVYPSCRREEPQIQNY